PPSLAVQALLDVVDLVLGPVLRALQLVLHAAGELIALALATQLVVVGEVADGLLGPALQIVSGTAHGGCSFRWAPVARPPVPDPARRQTPARMRHTRGSSG